ncbi:ABC transporter ATP-binding protein [Subtercola sp. YIM 133946]|uniref:ABC transporter ATP-binding protein n=1 Tax=Subtercola sp. YIM 133946 TaxID=3118909 RepID=UPI002F93F2BC
MSDVILSAEGLVKAFSVKRLGAGGRESFLAVDTVGFTLHRGGALAIVGESGSGKSTCARMIVGLERATAGTLVVEGRDWNMTRRLSTAERRRRGGVVQMVFQDPYQSLDPRQRAGDCIDEALRLHTALSPVARRARVAELFGQVRLDPGIGQAYPKTLSGGQRQRVAIARALAAEPRILILDEAVSALDVSIQRDVLAVLSGIRADTGVSFLFISHDLPVVRSLCDDVVVLRNGTVVEAGRVQAVLDDPQNDYTRRLIDSVPRRGWKPRRRAA